MEQSQNKTSEEHALKVMPVIPKASWWLVLKNILSMLNNPLDFLTEWAADYGDIYDLNSRFVRIHVISNPDYIQEILVRNKTDYAKSEHYKVLKESLGNGLLISEGEFWKKQRRIAQPAFHQKSMHNFLNTMLASTKASIAAVRSKKIVDIDQVMNALTLDIVTKCLFGTTLQADVHKIQDAISTGNKFISTRARSIIKWPLWLPLPANIRYKRARKFSDSVIFGIINQRKATDEEYHDLLAMLMHTVDEQTGDVMSAQQLRDESITLFVAGQETTATALTWTFYLLLKAPDKLAKLRAEIEEVLQGRAPDFQALKQLSYTQMVLEEAMRLYPPAWVIARKVKQDTQMCGYPLKKDTQLILNVYSMHRHPGHWENPDAFMPERFDEATKKNRHKYAYIPFGAGQRLCIGNNFAMMEMKIVLAMFVQHFEFDWAEGPIDLQANPMITLRPNQGLKLSVRPVNH